MQGNSIIYKTQLERIITGNKYTLPSSNSSATNISIFILSVIKTIMTSVQSQVK